MCITSRYYKGFSNYNPENAVITEDLRIRKLTPKECWRLQGFDDEDIDKCIAAGLSNTQLYKQAGNSITVNVLEDIFEKIYDENGFIRLW